jgi:hypothetical protein
MARILRRVLAACDPRRCGEPSSAAARWLMCMLDPTAPALTLRFLPPESALD